MGQVENCGHFQYSHTIQRIGDLSAKIPLKKGIKGILPDLGI